MPADRGARVSVLVSGQAPLVVGVPNAIWDPRHEPANWGDVRGKAVALLQPHGIDEAALYDWVRTLTTETGGLPDLDAVLGASVHIERRRP